MPAIIPAIAQQLALGARDLLTQAGAILSGNQAGYIATGEPESIYGKIQQETARQACRRYADEPGKFSGGAKVLVENACRPYLDGIGYGSPGSIKLPFEGGQCADLYRAIGFVSFNRFFCPDGPSIPNELEFATEFSLQGPIGGVRLEQGDPGQCGPRRVTIFVTIADGSEVSAFSTLDIFSRSLRDPQIVSINFERVGGASDDCGNPPPDITDPTPPPTAPGPPREPFNPSPDINIDIGVEINPDGTINVDFGTGPISIDPFGDDGGDGGGGGTPPPGDLGEPGGSGDTGTGGDTDGEAPPGSVLTALKINILSTPPKPIEFSPGIFRAVCYAFLGTDDGLDLDPAGASLRDGQLILAEKDNLTRWSVRANPGYNLRVTPFYRALE